MNQHDVASVRLKFLACVIAGQSPNGEDVTDVGSLPFIQGSAEFGNRSPSATKWCDVAPKIAEEGDVLVSVRAPVGDANVADRKIGIGRGVAAVRAKGQFAEKYLYWFFVSAKEVLRLQATGTTFEAVSSSDLENLRVPLLSESLRLAIASYLDVETARIDALIQAKLDLKTRLEGFAKSTFLAEMLAHAKALPGMEVDRMQWLPTVPTAWIRCKVKHLVEQFDQGVSPQCESRPPSEHEWGVLKAGCINSGSFNPLESKALPPEIASIPEVTVSKGDLIISRANTQSLVGRSAVAQKDYPTLMLSDKLYRLKLDRSRCVPEFIRRTLWIPAVRQRIEERATGASPSMLNIDRRTILEIDVVLPSLPEQLRLLEIVDRRADAIAELIRHVDRELDLLRDLRSSTVTDAVLGRIDIRAAVQNQRELEAA